ncbi:hypothetical protein AFL01nite_21510 [Aeromicrobium flavum]|uniref:Uncharacterized protein n=1 Tax=Aeromicrobium flavum TaxID=416568 RepID=A0A512HWJ8_9ACTN|nr:hypothetical protein AFL01nite_21510 [Aeromicrobium flavum]
MRLTLLVFVMRKVTGEPAVTFFCVVLSRRATFFAVRAFTVTTADRRVAPDATARYREVPFGALTETRVEARIFRFATVRQVRFLPSQRWRRTDRLDLLGAVIRNFTRAPGETRVSDARSFSAGFAVAFVATATDGTWTPVAAGAPTAAVVDPTRARTRRLRMTKGPVVRV